MLIWCPQLSTISNQREPIIPPHPQLMATSPFFIQSLTNTFWVSVPCWHQSRPPSNEAHPLGNLCSNCLTQETLKMWCSMSDLTGNCEETHAFSCHLSLDPRCLSHARWMGTWGRIRFITLPSGQMCAQCFMNVSSFNHHNNHAVTANSTVFGRDQTPLQDDPKGTFMTHILQKKVKAARSHSQCVAELGDPSQSG